MFRVAATTYLEPLRNSHSLQDFLLTSYPRVLRDNLGGDQELLAPTLTRLRFIRGRRDGFALCLCVGVVIQVCALCALRRQMQIHKSHYPRVQTNLNSFLL